MLTALFLLGYFALPWAMPFPQALLSPPPQGQEITDREGRSLRRLLADGHRTSASLKLDEIPITFRNATLAAEDKRFYSHGGIDFLSLGRAMRDAVLHRRATSGASTITQQLVKITTPRPRTLWTKVQEMLTARRIEMTWPKDRILEEYLNRLDYGNLRTGCATAAQGYFAKPLRDCSVAESALLAGLPQAPTRLNPYHHFQRSQKRQNTILSRMVEAEMLSTADQSRAREEPLKLAKDYGEFLAPHLVELVLDRTEKKTEKLITTLDLPLQQFCERTISNRVSRLREHNVQQAACMVIDNATGRIRALVGSADFNNTAQQGQVNGTTARRSPGSALKPFTYLLALQTGDSPSTMVADIPIEFITPSGLYRPKNYSGRTYGPVSYRIALANSLNLSAVHVLEKLGGPEPLINALQSCGLTTLTRKPAEYGLGLTIGGGEITLFELANAYATLARSGEFRPLKLLESDPVEESPERLFDPIACYLLADIMADNAARTPSFGSRSSLRLPFPVAVKTGTSTDYRDNWTLGFTPEFTVAVWAGNFDGTPMRNISGVTGAAPIFRDIFTWLDARHRQTWYAQPETVQTIPVDPLTGYLIPAELADKRPPAMEKFRQEMLPGSAPEGQYDAAGRVLLPDNFRSWVASPDNYLGNTAALAPVGSPLQISQQHLKILSPLAGSSYLLDPDLPEDGRILPLRSNFPESEVSWSSPTLEIIHRNDKVSALMVPGTHVLTVKNQRTGDSKEAIIVVRKL